MYGKIVVMLACAILLTGISFAAEDQAAKEKAALASSLEWLKLVDAGKYAESWAAAAEFFKSKVTRDQWVQALEKIRKPLGASSSRVKSVSVYKTSLPGVPDGEYVVIQFDTVLSDKKTYQEILTPMKDKDGKWRISGYFIKLKDAAPPAQPK